MSVGRRLDVGETETVRLTVGDAEETVPSVG